MHAGDDARPEPTVSGHGTPGWRPILGGVLALGAAAAVLVVVVWWRRGGARRAVKELAEHGAVALADAIVDEVLPAA